MESSGAPNRIQVTLDVKKNLEPKGYQFQSRGFINIKGIDLNVRPYTVESTE